jgi:hypothetical protein
MDIKNNVDFDQPLPKKLFEDCIRCGEFIISDDKAEITLFMLDHYGSNRLCKAEWVISCNTCGDDYNSPDFWDFHQTMEQGRIWCIKNK